MIKHIVMFRFRPEATPAQRAALLAEYPGFPGLHPQMRRLDMGANRSKRDDRFEHAFVIELDSWQDLDRYLDSEAHEEHVHQRFRPLIEERAIVSFEYEP